MASEAQRNTEQDFWPKLDRSDPEACWPWPGAVGYGKFNFEKKLWTTHRMAWRFTYGEIPEGLCVCHRCDNPPCCNPKHLFLGTNLDNIADRHAKGRDGIPPPRTESHNAKLRKHLQDTWDSMSESEKREIWRRGGITRKGQKRGPYTDRAVRSAVCLDCGWRYGPNRATPGLAGAHRKRLGHQVVLTEEKG